MSEGYSPREICPTCYHNKFCLHHHEQLTWCYYHKHEVDYDLVHFCKIIPKKGCANCSFCTTLKITQRNVEGTLLFEVNTLNGYANHPFLDAIQEAVNQPLVVTDQSKKVEP